ncbi:hypothetical protein PENSUB_1811, partial [Penicillium subrubescens]
MFRCLARSLQETRIRHSKSFLNQYSDFSNIMRSGMASGISPEPLQLHELYHPDNRL